MNMIARERIRCFTGYIPSQRCDQDETHHRGGRNQNKGAAEASPEDETVGFDARDDCHVDRRQVPNHRIRNRHRRQYKVQDEAGRETEN